MLHGPYHSISNYLNAEQVKVCYSDRFAIQVPNVMLLGKDTLRIANKIQRIRTKFTPSKNSSYFNSLTVGICLQCRRPCVQEGTESYVKSNWTSSHVKWA